jgi:DNA modification methylase
VTGKKVADYRPARRNANKHTARGLGALQQSVQTDGWIGAMTAAADGEMIAGSARIETVAQVFGTDAEPIVVETDGTRPVLVVRTDIPTADDKRAQRLALADNRVQEIDLTWDVEVLAGFDADVLGDLWTPEELSDLGQQWADEQKKEQVDAGAQIDKAEELRAKWGVESGQLWQLGEHRLICGDCTDAATVARVMGGERIELVWTDPPYGVSVGDKNKYLNSIAPSNRVEENLENDTLDESGIIKLLCESFDNAIVHCTVGAAWYVAAPPGPLHLLFGQVLKERGIWRQTIQWVKNNSTFSPMGVCYHWQAEPIFFGWLPNGGHRWHGGRQQTTVWNIDRPTKSPEHPTMKPVELVARAVENSSQSGEVIYDPFLGSGTTLIACERLGRKCRAVEISPAYCAVALERWAQTTGGIPILANGA